MFPISRDKFGMKSHIETVTRLKFLPNFYINYKLKNNINYQLTMF